MRLLLGHRTFSKDDTWRITFALAPELTKAAARASLTLDSFQTRVDLSLWPELMERCFAFVANYQILASDIGSLHAHATDQAKAAELQSFIKENTESAQSIQHTLSLSLSLI